jgi:hypothetical protein
MATRDTDYTQRAIIVVTAAAVTAANGRANQVDRTGGDKTFTVGLSATGLVPATHYWCSWLMTPGEYTDLTTRLDGIPNASLHVRVFDGNVMTAEDVLAATGLRRIEATGHRAQP